ncbi:MAG: aspartate aminotransferase family protein [Rhodobacteraceae bacterium]|nr:aspartate aminotransferase family protein [Paracoccaceae bacterium]
MANHVFHRTPTLMPEAALGDGCYLVDSTGKRYFDAGGAAVSCLGHSDTHVADAIKAQVDKLAFAHSGFFTSAPAEALADKLIEYAPEGIERVYLVSGGSEAVEAAIKLARQYFVEKGQPERGHVIARKQSYHGNTLGALSAGGNEWRRGQFAPLLLNMTHISPCYEYRLRGEAESAEAYGLRAADELETEVLRVGAEQVMAFVAEPIVGATLGAVPAAKGYFTRIREICDRYGVLLILDEVMCGMGRTGTLFACEQEGVRPDILTIAKGLGAGYQPIGAMLCSGEIYQTITEGSGFFQHGHTYMGHPVAAACGLAVLERIVDDGLLARVRSLGDYMEKALGSALAQHPNVGDIRGRGLFGGVELVADRASKATFDPALKIAPKIKKAAMANGLMCYPMQGTIDGQHGDHVLLAPPFTMDETQVDEMVDKLKSSILEVLAEGAP